MEQHNVHVFCYTNNLIGDNRDNSIIKLCQFYLAIQKYNVEISVDKTKYLIISRAMKCKLMIQDALLNKVQDNLRYLATEICNRNDTHDKGAK